MVEPVTSRDTVRDTSQEPLRGAVYQPHAGEGRALSVIGTIALVLLIIGGLNWALVGLFNIDLVATLFGTMTAASRAVYVIVGVAALVAFALFRRVARPAP